MGFISSILGSIFGGGDSYSPLFAALTTNNTKKKSLSELLTVKPDVSSDASTAGVGTDVVNTQQLLGASINTTPAPSSLVESTTNAPTAGGAETLGNNAGTVQDANAKQQLEIDLRRKKIKRPTTLLNVQPTETLTGV